MVAVGGGGGVTAAFEFLKMSIAFDPPHISSELPVQSMLQSLEEIGAPGVSITLSIPERIQPLHIRILLEYRRRCRIRLSCCWHPCRKRHLRFSKT